MSKRYELVIFTASLYNLNIVAVVRNIIAIGLVELVVVVFDILIINFIIIFFFLNNVPLFKYSNIK